MVDTATLIVISTVSQTIVLTITLIVFILQFRSQEKSIKESSHQGLMGRYNDLVSMLADKPDLAMSLFSHAGLPGETGRTVSKEDISIYSHLLLAYGIIEEAFLLYEKKWITKEEWEQWAEFLKRLAMHPLFPTIFTISSGTFDDKFEDYISHNILADEKKDAKK